VLDDNPGRVQAGKRFGVKYVVPLLLKKEPVVVFSPGRVGSTAIYLSLLDSGVPAIHLHRLPNLRSEKYKRPLVSFGLLNLTGVKNVVGGYREPISWLVSNYFQKLHKYTGDERPYRKSAKYLKENFVEKYLPNYARRPLSWFERIFNKSLGVGFGDYKQSEYKDCYEISKGEVVVVIVRAGVDDVSKEGLIREKLRVGEFKISKKNRTARKKFGGLYAKFREKLKLKKEVIREIYSYPDPKFFFDENDLKGAIAKWGK